MNALSFIHAMVAPSVVISACGLLLLGMNNKYSLVVNRIRLLNAEYRSEECSSERRECIRIQIPELQKRMKLIKNAVWLYTLSVIFTVVAMILIAISELWDMELFYPVIVTFSVAVLFILVGSINAAQETRLGYKIITEIEINRSLQTPEEKL